MKRAFCVLVLSAVCVASRFAAAAYVPPAPPAGVPLATVKANLNSSGTQVINVSSSTDLLSGSYSGNDCVLSGFVNGGTEPSTGGTVTIGDGYYVGGHVDCTYVYAFLIGPKDGADASVSEGTSVPASLSYAVSATHSGGTTSWEGYSYSIQTPGFALISGNGSLYSGLNKSEVVSGQAAYGRWQTVTMSSSLTITSSQSGQAQTGTFILDPAITVASDWLSTHPNDTVYLETIPVPEPTSMLLLVAGLGGLAVARPARGSR